MIHPDDEHLMPWVTTVAETVAKAAGLPLRAVEAKRRPLETGSDGVCYVEEGRIAIKLRNKERMSDGGKWWRERLPDHEILRTVVHEVCHLDGLGDNADHRRRERVWLHWLAENHPELVTP